MPRAKARAPKRLSSASEDGVIYVSNDDLGAAALVPKSRKRKYKDTSWNQSELEHLLSEHEFTIRGIPPTQRKDHQDLFFFGQIKFVLTHRFGDSGDGLHQSWSNCGVYIGSCKGQPKYHIIYRDTDKWLMCPATSSVPKNILWAVQTYCVFLCVIAQVDVSSISLDVLLAPSGISQLDHPADVASCTVNFGIQDVVQHFLGVTHPRYTTRQHLSRQNFDELYDRVAAMQASQELDEGPLLEVQHPGLVPVLRPYQRDVVRWMLLKERQPPVTDAKDNFLYTMVVDRRGKELFYNAFGGFFAREKFALPSARPGGILADEMGLGKTVELLACILHNQRPHFDTGSVSRCKAKVCQNESRDESAGGTKVDCFCGKFRSEDSIEEIVLCPECGVYQHVACTTMGDLHSYTCPQCWVKPHREKLKVKTTLIVVPSSISFQWLDEIQRHQTELSVMVYEGLQSQGFVPPTTFAKHDIVLITYEVLKKEIHFTDLPNSNAPDGRSLRNPKKFLAPPCPLMALEWWRVCLDEAQMVESASANVSKMALRLSAVNRWCVTGTPIQKSLQDLYGLLLFLGEEPYSTELWWKELLLIPYCNGNTEPLVSVLSRCFKRTLKRNVLKQIGVPPQESHFHSLHFCPVEEVFYKREANKCASAFLEQVRKFPDHSVKIKMLDRHSVGLLLQPLRCLRQACCHPQAVRGSCLPTRTDTMTMEELLTSLIKKTTVECEEAHRRMISAMNGIAGIYIIQDRFEEAADTYRDVLWSAKDHCKNIKTDRLQQLHALHNLAQLLDACKPSSKAAACPDASLTSKNGIVHGAPSDARKASSEFLAATDALAVCIGVLETKSEADLKAPCTEDILMADTATDTTLAAPHETSAETPEPNPGKGEADTGLKSPVDMTPNVRLELLLRDVGCPSSSRFVDAKVSEIERARPKGTSALLASRLTQASTPMPAFRNVSYIPQAPNDDRLEEEASKLKETYLESYVTRTVAAKEQMLQAVQAVGENMKKFSLPEGKPWWNVLLNRTVENSLDIMLLLRVNQDLETNKSSMAPLSSVQFTSVSGLQYSVASQLTQLHNAREALLRAVGDLSAEPSSEELTSAVECHLRPSRKKRDKCQYCIVDKMFNLYEDRLFCFTEGAAHKEAPDVNDARPTSTRRGNWGDSNLEKIIKTLAKNASCCGDKAVCNDGAVHVQLFAAFKKEFRAMRAVCVSTIDLVSALDELEMATVRLEVQLPDSTSHSNSKKEDEDSIPKPMNVLSPWEVPEQLSKLLSERELYKTHLRKKLGQLFYLQNLEKAAGSGQGASNPEPCPICQNPLGERWSVIQCGHNFCIECIQMMLVTPACSRNGRLLCAVCRSTSAHEDIFFVDVKASTRDASELPVKGGHSAKTEGIVRTLLKLKAEDPLAKALVFSSWPIVLDVLRKALEDNDVSYILLKAGYNFENKLALFKHDPEVSVLLLPLSLGAKGLNLTEATHVLLVEPILNTADELQAIGRVHRIGQTKTTHIHRFMIQNTIEEKIVDFVKSSLTSRNPSEDYSKMTISDLKKFFE